MADYKTITNDLFELAPFEALLKRRLFYTEAFEIYRKASNFNGDNKGLYDYGPPGCSLQANIVDLWRKHFVLEEEMLELDCTILTPEDVFRTSGHLEKFSDWMCKDPKTGDLLRVDHLVRTVLEGRLRSDMPLPNITKTPAVIDPAAREAKELQETRKTDSKVLTNEVVEEYEQILAAVSNGLTPVYTHGILTQANWLRIQIDNLDGPELYNIIKKLDIRNPNGNGEVLEPVRFNLMFKTAIGPTSLSPGYLRPETAQGHFVNFKKLLNYNQNVVPFASASVGKSFRNEISPRSGLLRMREFLMAEIEHYVDPKSGKKHARFHEVRDIRLVLLDRHTQLECKTKTVELPIGEAVDSGMIGNETLGYFLARIYIFLVKVGADGRKVRFRQHMANEMAHYAADCWDAELLTSHGWIECVGCADRSAYDLTVHAERTGEALKVRELRKTPLEIEEWHVELNRKKLGPLFRQHAKAVELAVDSFSQEERRRVAASLQSHSVVTIDVQGNPNGKAELDHDLLKIFKRQRLDRHREYVPNVIEPSFGIGRIMYSVLEHVYWHRPEDEARCVSFCVRSYLELTKFQ